MSHELQAPKECQQLLVPTLLLVGPNAKPLGASESWPPCWLAPPRPAAGTTSRSLVTTPSRSRYSPAPNSLICSRKKTTPLIVGVYATDNSSSTTINGGVPLGPALAICRSGGTYLIETGRSESDQFWPEGPTGIYLAEKSGWMEFDPSDVDYALVRGRADAAYHPQNKPVGVIAGVSLAWADGCEGSSWLENSLRDGPTIERPFALSENVPLDVKSGLGPRFHVGTGGYFSPTLIDLSTGLHPFEVELPADAGTP